ncbi:MAG TPA: TlpA disulfide reductase family protein [Bacteroidia bacterium]
MKKALQAIALTLVFTFAIMVFYAFKTKESLSVAKAKAYSDTLNLSAHKGKVVVINFWASWSKASRSENKNVVRLYEKYRQHPKLAFVSVSLDTDDKAWKQAVEEDEMIWADHVCDLKKYTSPIALKYGVKTLPRIVVIDSKGNIHISGNNMAEVESAIETLIK